MPSKQPDRLPPAPATDGVATLGMVVRTRPPHNSGRPSGSARSDDLHTRAPGPPLRGERDKTTTAFRPRHRPSPCTRAARRERASRLEVTVKPASTRRFTVSFFVGVSLVCLAGPPPACVDWPKLGSPASRISWGASPSTIVCGIASASRALTGLWGCPEGADVRRHVTSPTPPSMHALQPQVDASRRNNAAVQLKTSACACARWHSLSLNTFVLLHENTKTLFARPANETQLLRDCERPNPAGPCNQGPSSPPAVRRVCVPRETPVRVDGHRIGC